jgi:VCBS repeat protein
VPVLQLLILLLAQTAAQPPAVPAPGASRPADIAFNVQMIDPGYSESVAVADFNRDGRLDILSAEYWYEAPDWIKHKVRDIPFNGSYIDNFSDLAVDVDGDGYIDVVQIAYFARRIVWLKNPGKGQGRWVETPIDAVGPTEFAFLVDLNNDGKALEILPEFTGASNAPLAWYELRNGSWAKHAVASGSHGHGIGAGDVNGDKRGDIVTPNGWFESPAAGPQGAPGTEAGWVFHPTDWAAAPSSPGASTPPTLGPVRPPEYAFMYVIASTRTAGMTS